MVYSTFCHHVIWFTDIFGLLSFLPETHFLCLGLWKQGCHLKMFVDCGNSARCTDFQTLNLQHLGFLGRPCYCNQCQFLFIDFFVKTFLMFVYKRSFPICVTMISAGYSALLTSARLGRVGSNKLLLLSNIIFQTGGPVAFPCQVDH